MTKREFKGDPIDAAWHSHLSEIGEDESVVDGTSKDVNGQEKATVGSKNDSELASDIKNHALLNPSASVREIADKFDCNYSYVATVLRNKPKYYKPTLDETTAKQQRILEIVAQDNGLTRADAARWENVSKPYVSNLVNDNPHLINEISGGCDD